MKTILNWYTSTRWHQWWVNNVWKPTWTKLTTAIYGIPAGLAVVGQTASYFLNDTTIQGYLAKFNIPNWVPMTLAGIALVHYIASGRK
jgi:hypothetical protein